MFTAHIRESDNKVQSVSEHSLEVSELAGKYLKSVSLSEVGRLIGLLHDAGKLRKLFDDYINGRNNMRRGSIDHSYAGARYLKELAKDKDDEIKIATEGISTIIELVVKFMTSQPWFTRIHYLGYNESSNWTAASLLGLIRPCVRLSIHAFIIAFAFAGRVG